MAALAASIAAPLVDFRSSVQRSPRGNRRGRAPVSGFRPEEAIMTYEHILLDHEDGVGIVTLNRPDVLNAMNRKLSAELADAVQVLDADDQVGCIVITGAGERAFSAG